MYIGKCIYTYIAIWGVCVNVCKRVYVCKHAACVHVSMFVNMWHGENSEVE